MSTGSRDVAVLGGVRTQFSRANGQLAAWGSIQLGARVAGELAARFDLASADPRRTAILWGSALAYPAEIHGGREIAIAIGLPEVLGFGTEFACATSVKTVAEGAAMIRSGECDVVIAGGSESLSRRPVTVPAEVDRLARLRDPEAIERGLAGLTTRDMLPTLGGIVEPYDGTTLAHHCETLMRDWHVTRAEADRYAVQSHRRAAAARAHLAPRVLAADPDADPDTDPPVDDMIRGNSDEELLAGLPAVLPELGGRVAVGNSSRLTDGAAAVVLSARGWAEERGLSPEGWVASAALTAHAPADGVLLGPAFAVPRLFERAGVTLNEVDVVELHEAFAGQVLANLRALASPDFADRTGTTATVGEIDPEGVNRWGGSLSIGHPFGATGARLVMQTLDRLVDENGQLGLLALCVGGARGAALLLERA